MAEDGRVKSLSTRNEDVVGARRLLEIAGDCEGACEGAREEIYGAREEIGRRLGLSLQLEV